MITFEKNLSLNECLKKLVTLSRGSDDFVKGGTPGIYLIINLDGDYFVAILLVQ